MPSQASGLHWPGDTHDATLDIRWKQRFDNFQRALHQPSLAMELKAQRPLSELEQQGLVSSRGSVRKAFKRGLVINAAGRRAYNPASKAWIVEQTSVPGRSVAGLAMRNEVNANLLRHSFLL